MNRFRAVFLAGVTVCLAGPASAACFESGVGCTDSAFIPYPALAQLSCDALWTVRNTIFHERGYCFQTAKGKANFDNTGCTYMTTAQVPLNSYESGNVTRVQQVEKQKHC
jgi:hypothetical protein